MAKDTEKLIRQLSLISYLMAERRPVTALEIRRDVEGYSTMNEDAFARRFYADRSELDSLGIALTVERPVDGIAEQENYSLRPENFHLPAIAFTDAELAALQTALSLLDGEFAYAEPLRLALQQISWGRQNPLRAPEQRGVGLGITASAGGHDLSQRLAKIETAIFRNKTITFDYYTMARDATGTRKVDPYHLLFQGGQFYLLGHAHERNALRVFRLSRIQGKVAYATKSEHDFKGRPDDFDPRAFANRAVWQFGDADETAEVWISERIAWQIERHFGRFGEVRPAEGGKPGDIIFETPYADRRQLAAWALRLGEHARVLGPPELERELADRVELLYERHRDGADGSRPALELAATIPAIEPEPPAASGGGSRRIEAAIRPERIARLVTLASILIQAGRAGERLQSAVVCEQMQISDAELREDINVLNVVNFGGGSYVLYAEISDDGRDRGRPRALLRQLRAARAPAARRGEGAGRGHRPHRRAPARGLARLVAPEDRRRARRRSDGAGPARRRRRRRRLGDRAPRVRGDHGSPAAATGLLQAQRGRVLDPRRRALHADERPRGLVRRLLRPRSRRRAPLPPRPHPPRGGHRHDVRSASGGQPRGRRRRLAAHRRGRGLAHRARLGFTGARTLGARGTAGRSRARRRLRRSSS